MRGNTTRAKVSHLLKGIVFGNDWRALSPWHTTKKQSAVATATTCSAVTSRSTRASLACRDCRPLNSSRRVCSTNCAPSCALNLLGDMLPQAIKLDPT